jgi:hypothetical protein
MTRLLIPLFVLSVPGFLRADPVQDVLDAAPRLDAPGPGYRGERGFFVPLEFDVRSVSPVWQSPARPINPWDESYLVPLTVPPPANPAIDYPAFERGAGEVGRLREKRRISEEEFLRMAAEPGVIILDARSREKFEGLHIKGAVNLALPDITAEELARIIPNKDTRVLIYCNNNFDDLSAVARFEDVKPEYGSKGFVVFRNSGDGARLFPRKSPSASLNIYTFNTLHSYGYTNVFELGPLLEIQNSKLPFEGTSVVPVK